jgi:class 3 adenylate cyclase
MKFGQGEIHGISWASRAPGGFTDQDLTIVQDLVPALSVTIEVLHQRRTTATLLDTYLGREAGRRVLTGSIRRGEATTLAAALWYCDMRGFTQLSDRLERDQIVELLDDYFGCMAVPVEAMGGEILKFVGDAMLAIFPMRDDLDRDRACRDALTAAERALLDRDELNKVRGRASKPELKVGLGLHHGPVMYGNIGAATRLDFTVIGPAVNLVTRIESLCPALDRPLLTSRPFASPCGSRLKTLGLHALKGIEVPQEIFGLPGAASRTSARRRCEQTCQLIHLRQNDRGPGATQSLAVTAAAMGAAGESDRRHPGRARRFDPGQAVLDHPAGRGGHFHRLGREQKEIGRGLAARDLLGAEDMRAEAIDQPGQSQRMAQSRGRAAGRHADRDRDRGKRRRDAGHRFEIRREGRLEPGP